MSWRDVVRKSGCTAKMGTCSCEECLNKGGCPHCDGNAPKSECICGHTAKMKVRRKEPSDNRCPKCGEKTLSFLGGNTGLCNNPSCSEYNPEKLRSYGEETYPRRNPFTRKD